VQDLPEEEVQREAGQPATEKSPNDEIKPVKLHVVEQRARNCGRQHYCDAGQPDDRPRRVLSRLGGLVGVIAKRGENPARALQHE